MSTRGRTPTKFASWDDANEGDFDRFVWNKTTDPLFGDSNNAKALRKRIQRDAPELILQSPHHSHDRYFPSAVLNVPGLKRYLPDPATISEYCSASRGPQCYDRLGKPYKCHFAKGIPAFLYTHPDIKCAQAEAAGHDSVISRWDDKMKIQSCLSCYVKTKGICTWTSQPPYLPSAKSGATTSIPRKAPSEHDELSSEGDDGPANTSPPDIFAHLDLDGPQFEEEEGMITVANPSTPSKAVRKRDAALGSSGRKTKKPKTDVSLSHKKTSSGLPENPGRAQHSARTFRPVQTFAPPAPLEPAPPTPAPPSSGSPTPPPAPPAPLTPSPPSPDEWLAIRDAPTPDPKGKARAEFERPSESANRVQSASTTAQPSLHAPSSLAPGPHSPFGRFAQVESASINREQQSHPHPPAVANPPPVDLATSNRSRLQKTYDSSRDAIQAVLNQFAEDHANISRDLNEQYRILADAKGAQTRAEQDLVKEKETSDSLKRQLLVVETRNSELSGANRDYKVRLENLLAENQRANKANQEALGRLRDAKVVAEERQDTAANERTRAFEDRDKARAESEVNKKEAKTAEAVVRRAVQEKKDVVREAEDLREQVKLLTGELVSYRTASSSHAQERPGELEAIVGPNDAAQLAQEQVLANELGLAPPSSC